MTDQERAVMQQALEALWQGVKLLNYRGGTVECLPLHDAITALRDVLAQQAEPVEPHRWEGDHNIESPFNACMHKHYCMTLKQALAQRAPLTEGVLMGVYIDFDRTAGPAWSKAEYLLRLCRAVERAHGITAPQIEDRLARHGIPMPGDPKC